MNRQYVRNIKVYMYWDPKYNKKPIWSFLSWCSFKGLSRWDLDEQMCDELHSLFVELIDGEVAPVIRLQARNEKGTKVLAEYPTW